ERGPGLSMGPQRAVVGAGHEAVAAYDSLDLARLGRDDDHGRLRTELGNEKVRFAPALAGRAYADHVAGPKALGRRQLLGVVAVVVGQRQKAGQTAQVDLDRVRLVVDRADQRLVHAAGLGRLPAQLLAQSGHLGVALAPIEVAQRLRKAFARIE